jgi:hypothetical protein
VDSEEPFDWPNDRGWDESNYTELRDTPTAEEVAETFERAIANAARREREKAAEPSLAPYDTSWDAIAQHQVELFERGLETASSERDMQVFLEENPILLV